MDKKIKEVLARQVLLIKPGKKEQETIGKETERFLAELGKGIKKRKIKAEIFIGGSLAKDTIVKKEKYDVDIFVRFDKKYQNLSSTLNKVLRKAKKVHGSRDYFQIRKGKMIFEIIPVLKINKPEEARNVTDLSYFHVRYITNKIKKNKKLADEIRLSKTFCYAQNCYGAESYIRGFSGYALELLVCYYGSFSKFIKAIKGKKRRIILDPAGFYKNKQEILLELNESKLQSPIVFVDPTFKERNALAALSTETLEKFQQSCASFLKKPSNKFFEKQNLEKELKNKYKNLTIIKAGTNRQKGDIAGSKLRKFHNFLVRKMEKYFDIKINEFEYLEERNMARIYLVLKNKKVVIEGPQITAVEHLSRFKKKHKNCFIKGGRGYARENPPVLKRFIENLKKDKAVKEMGIKKVELAR